ncbi:WD-40 repeat-containing protein [Gongronella butleri]|nr:WD-40 repeat-containing protein [Gongronella butleri]
MIQEELSEREKEINEEYRHWKKNTPFLYDTVLTQALDWPSLTCQWLPDVEVREDKGYTLHRLVLGTHTNDEEPNHLQIAEVRLPIPARELDTRKYDETTNEIGGYGGFNDAHIKITQKIVHKGEVNRARYQYSNPNIIATKVPDGDVCIFDRTTHASFPKPGEHARPALFLKGHSSEGYGLEWNPHTSRANHLISAGFDGLICHWDIGSARQDHRTLQPIRTYVGHTSAVEDVAWHFGLDTLFASVGDDKQLMMWDTRQNDAVQQVLAHDAEVNSVDFNKHNEYLLATASGDKTAALWDLRNMNHKIHELVHHKDELFQVAWSPHDETILATASSDRRVLVWDIARMGDEARRDEHGPPELLFMHGGHTNKISDFNWHPGQRWTIASAAEDNVVQVWQMASNIYNQDDDQDVPASPAGIAMEE